MSIHPELLNILLQQDLKHFLSDSPDGTIRQRAASSLSNSLLKKLAPSKDTSIQDSAALDLFAKMNQHCASFNFTPDLYDDATFIAFTYARDLLSQWQTSELDYPSNISWRGRFGPGATIGSKSEDFVSKSSVSQMCGTDPVLYDLYKHSITRSKTDLLVEKTRRDRFGGYIEVEGSRTSCVPKTSKISRTICTEPLLNMFIQQGIGAYLADCLKMIGINLSSQQLVNRAMARQGSLDGSLATIDLSSASDTISMSLCKWLLPQNLMEWLRLARSPRTKICGGYLELHMISSMGNGFTFPLQTMIFSAIVQGAYKALGTALRDPLGKRTWSVFGDDIIVTRESYNFVCHLLRVAGFFPNMDKSFNVGLFRESCGADFYKGSDIRGIYIKSLETQHDRYSAINRLAIWSARWDIPLYRTISYLVTRVKYRPIPFYENWTAGIYVPSSLAPRNFCYETLEILPRSKKAILGCITTFQGGLQGAVRAGRIGLRLQAVKSRKSRKQSSGWDCFRHGDIHILDVLECRRWKHLLEVVCYDL